MQCSGCYSIKLNFDHKKPGVVIAKPLTRFSYGQKEVDLCEDCAQAAWSDFFATIVVINSCAAWSIHKIREEEQKIRTKEIQAARQTQNAFQAPKE